MLADVIDTRRQIIRRLPWLSSVAVVFFGLDCYQNDEGIRAFLAGAILLLVVHVIFFLVAYLSRPSSDETKQRVARRLSYVIVFLGAGWVVIRLLKGDWLQASAVYLNAFMIGGLSGGVSFLRKMRCFEKGTQGR